MDAFLTSVSLVALGEIGDKTQLLALLLAARFQKPTPIIAGILCAVLLNHALAAGAGHFIGAALDVRYLHILLAVSFIGIGLWGLHPDTLKESTAPARYGVFFTSFIAFFIGETGDKTQLATLALGAHFTDFGAVVLGSTLGMLIADIPAVFAGHAVLKRLPVKALRYVTSLLFILFGLWEIAAIVWA